MAFAHSFAHGLGAVVTSWPVYALIAGELAALILAQTTYQTDTPLITLPVITAVMPIASLAVGIFALHETTHLSGARVAVVTGCLALAVGALVVLARSAAHGDHAPSDHAAGDRMAEDGAAGDCTRPGGTSGRGLTAKRPCIPRRAEVAAGGHLAG